METIRTNVPITGRESWLANPKGVELRKYLDIHEEIHFTKRLHKYLLLTLLKRLVKK